MKQPHAEEYVCSQSLDVYDHLDHIQRAICGHCKHQTKTLGYMVLAVPEMNKKSPL